MIYDKWKNKSIENMEGEVWKPVPDYEGTFASNYGRIKTDARTVKVCGGGERVIEATIKNQVLSKDGYLRTDAVKNGKLKKSTAHRLCALAFKPNPEGKKTVQHNNHIRHCNEEWNLCWFTQSEQLQDAYDSDRRKPPMGMLGKKGYNHPMSKAVIQYDSNMNYIQEFGSLAQAALSIGLDNSDHIIKCCKLKKGYETVKGFIFKYKVAA